MNSMREFFRKIQKTAHSYGVRKIAEQLNLQRGTFYNKLNTDESCIHHKLTLQEFIDIVRITNDKSILISLCGLFNYSAYELPNTTELADEALLDVINSVHISSGQTHRAMAEALEDGRITQEEYVMFSRQVFGLLSGIMSWQARVQAMVDG